MSDSNIVIRQTQPEDLPKICSLFDNKDENILRWVLSNVQNQEHLCSYVAVDQQNQIVGHVGYIKNTYNLNGSRLTSIHPIEWRIAKGSTGSIGITLINKVTSLGDFVIIIGGTKEAHRIYPFLGLERLGNAIVLSRVVDYPRYLVSHRSLGRKLITVMETLYNLRSLLRYKSYSDVSVTTVRPSDAEFQMFCQTNSDNMSMSKSKINWLCSCPWHEKHIIRIDHSSELIGYAILFFNQKTKSVRIMNILGRSNGVETYRIIIMGLVQLCRKLSAIDISVLSTDKVLLEALEQERFRFSGQKAVFAKINSHRVLDRQMVREVQMSYAEGDLGYRF